MKQSIKPIAIRVGLALMSLHIFFNIVTFLGTPQKNPGLPSTSGSPLHKFSCETPAAPPVSLEIFSALGFNAANNPFAGKPAPAQQCPSAPTPLT